MRKSKKGYALPTAIVVTAVLLILASAFVAITYNNVNTTSRDLSSREAYINAKSALIYATAYYKADSSRLPSEGSTHYIVMNSSTGSVTEGAVVKTSTTGSDDWACYVETKHTVGGNLELTAYARYGSALQGRSTNVRTLGTKLYIDLDVNSGGGVEVEVPNPTLTYEEITLVYDLDVEEADSFDIYVKRNEKASYNPYVYTWAYATGSGNYAREIDAWAIKVGEGGGFRATEVNPTDVWRHGGSNAGVGSDAVATLVTSGEYSGMFGISLTGNQMLYNYYGTDTAKLAWYNSYGCNYYNRLASSSQRINKLSAIITLEGADNGNNQSNEMFDLPTTRGKLFIETLTSALNYYAQTSTLQDNSNNDQLSVYTKNTVVHVKLQGYDSYNAASDNLKIAAQRYNAAQSASVRNHNSLMDSADPLISGSANMVYEGNGWYKYSIKTSDNFTMNITGTLNGKSINVPGEYVKNMDECYIYITPNGSSWSNTEKKPNSDQSITVHVKVGNNIKGSNPVQLVTTTTTADAVKVIYQKGADTATGEDKITDAYIGSNIYTDSGDGFINVGYMIAGWEAIDGTIFTLGQQITINESYVTTATDGTKQVILKAIWNEETTNLIVNFHSNGSVIWSNEVGYNAVLTFPETPADQDGKYMAFWSSTAGGTGTKYTPGLTYYVTTNMNIYAQWRDYSTVTFEGNGSDEAFSEKFENLKEGDTITTPAAPVKTGYTFLGWSDSATSGGNVYAAESSYTVTSSITLYALWKSDSIEEKEIYFEAPSGWSNNIYVKYHLSGSTDVVSVKMNKMGDTNIYEAKIEVGDVAPLVYFQNTDTDESYISKEATFVENTVYRVKGYEIKEIDGVKHYYKYDDASFTEVSDPRNLLALLDTSKTFTSPYYVNGYVIYGWNVFENNQALTSSTQPFYCHYWGGDYTTAWPGVKMQRIADTRYSVYFVPKNSENGGALEGYIVSRQEGATLNSTADLVLSNAYDITNHKVLKYVKLDRGTTGDPTIYVTEESVFPGISESCISNVTDSDIVYTSAGDVTTGSSLSENTVELDVTSDDTVSGSTGTVYTMVAEDTRIYYVNKQETDRYDTYGGGMQGSYGWQGKRRGNSKEVGDTWYTYTLSQVELSSFKIKIGSLETQVISNPGTDVYMVIDNTNSIYYEYSSGTPNAYMWHSGLSGQNNGAWPGVPMTKVKDNIYKIDTGIYNKVKFASSSGAGTTGDLDIQEGKIYNGGWSTYNELTFTAYNANPDDMLTTTTRVYYQNAGGIPKLGFKSITDTDITVVNMLPVTDDDRYANLYYYDVPNDKIHLYFGYPTTNRHILNVDSDSVLATGSTAWATYKSPSATLMEALTSFKAAYRKYTLTQYNTSGAVNLRTGTYAPVLETIDGETSQKLSNFDAFNPSGRIVSYIENNIVSFSGGECITIANSLNKLIEAAKETTNRIYTGRVYIPAYNMGITVNPISSDDILNNLDIKVKEAVSEYPGVGTTVNSTPITSISDLVSRINSAVGDLDDLSDGIKNSLTSEIIGGTNTMNVALIKANESFVSNIVIHYTEDGVEKTTAMTSANRAAGTDYYYYWMKENVANVYFTYTSSGTNVTGTSKSMGSGEQWIYEISANAWRANSAVRTCNISTSILYSTSAAAHTFTFNEGEEVFYINFEKDCKLNISGTEYQVYAGTYYVHKADWTDGQVVVPSVEFYNKIRLQMFDITNNRTVKEASAISWIDTAGQVVPRDTLGGIINPAEAGITVNFFVNATNTNMYLLRSGTSSNVSTSSGTSYTAFCINFKWVNTEDTAIDLEFIGNNKLILNAANISIGMSSSIKRTSSSAHFYVGDGESDGILKLKILSDLTINDSGTIITIKKGVYTIPASIQSTLVSKGAKFESNRIDLFSCQEVWDYLDAMGYRVNADSAISGGI